MNDEEAACTSDKQNNAGGALLQASQNPSRCNSSSNYSVSGSSTQKEGPGSDEEANSLLRDALEGSSSDVTAMLGKVLPYANTLCAYAVWRNAGRRTTGVGTPNDLRG